MSRDREPQPRAVDVLLPAKNESADIQGTLRNILTQAFSGEYSYNVLVITNGCNDDTAEKAQEMVSEFDDTAHVNLVVHEEDRPGKIRALNVGLAATRAEVVLCTDADIIAYSDGCLDMVTTKLCEPGVIVSGAAPKSEVRPSLEGTLIGEVQETSEIIVRSKGIYTVPIGFLMGFRRSAVPAFPENARVDDVWLGLYVWHEYGPSAIQIEPNAHAYSYFPETFTEWLAQSTRWARYSSLVVERFQEYEHALNERQAWWEQISLPEDEVNSRIRAAMEKRNLPTKRLAQYEAFRDFAIENARLMPGIVKEDSTW